jgi:hypothetical protein
VLVFLGAYTALIGAGYALGETYLAAWLPLLELEVDWILPPDLAREALVLEAAHEQRLIVLAAITTSAQSFGATTVPADVDLWSSTLQAYALHHPIIVYAMLAAWPARSLRHRLRLLLLGVPCVLITTSLDIPFVLVGQLRDLLLANLAPTALDSDPRAVYFAFLHGGGRLGLAVAGAAAVIALERASPRRVVRPASAARAGRRARQNRGAQ